jgi:inner membrane protein
MAFWSALSLLPDVDIAGFALGVDYGAQWGHRGATHSLALSVALGAAIGLAAHRLKRPALRTALVAAAVLASHALLDTITDGGLGCALLWPFDLTRYFAPWRPIPVAPIGLDFFSRYGAMVSLAELVLFAPVLLFALRSPRLSRKHAGFLVALWLAAVSLAWYSNTARDAITGFLLGEDTRYTTGFTEAAFRTITPGRSEREVRDLLGRPFGEFWFYTPADSRPPDERPAPTGQACLIVRFEAGVVAAVHDIAACRARGVGIGLFPIDVDKRLGSPTESCWQYSWSPRGATHRERLVCFASEKVRMVVRKWS